MRCVAVGRPLGYPPMRCCLLCLQVAVEEGVQLTVSVHRLILLPLLLPLLAWPWLACWLAAGRHRARPLW